VIKGKAKSERLELVASKSSEKNGKAGVEKENETECGAEIETRQGKIQRDETQTEKETENLFETNLQL